MAIIAILLGMIVPGVQSMRASARRAHCMSNLHNIGVAFLHQRTTTNAPIRPSGWKSSLLPYMQENTQIFVCVEDQRPITQSTGDAAAFIRINGGPN